MIVIFEKSKDKFYSYNKILLLIDIDIFPNFIILFIYKYNKNK